MLHPAATVVPPAEIDAVQPALAPARERKAGPEADLTSIVAMVRNAVSTIADDNRSYAEALDTSTERFDALVGLDDPAELKRRLGQEVEALRRLTSERQRTWQSTVAEFSGRIEELETRLVASQAEAAADPLTNVANRRTFDRSLREWMAATEPRCTLIMIDLDRFKAINDTHGHPMGDRVLIVTARILKAAVRRDDLVARLGGDEFAILSHGLTLARADDRFRRVIENLEQGPTDGREPPLVPFSFSCGLTECATGDTRESLTCRADQALLDAKKRGRHRLVVRNAPRMRERPKQWRRPGNAAARVAWVEPGPDG